MGVKQPRKARKEGLVSEPWEQNQMTQFRSHADNDVWASAWRLTLSGLRRSEVLGLAWSNVDLEEGTVSVAAGRVALNSRDTTIDESQNQLQTSNTDEVGRRLIAQRPPVTRIC